MERQEAGQGSKLSVMGSLAAVSAMIHGQEYVFPLRFKDWKPMEEEFDGPKSSGEVINIKDLIRDDE